MGNHFFLTDKQPTYARSNSTVKKRTSSEREKSVTPT